MKHHRLLPTGKPLLGLLCAWLSCCALQASTPKEDSIRAYFHVLERIPQEKLYLHLDKPYYSAGEKIWFKGYLLNAVTHRDDALSNFFVAELVDRTDSVVMRKKIRRDSLGFRNAFELPANLPEGEYYLRAYSNWMLNADPAFHYDRHLHIGNAIDRSIRSSIEYPPSGKGRHQAVVRFANNSGTPFADTYVKYQYFENGRPKDRGRRKTDAQGQIYVELDNAPDRAERRIEVQFDDPAYTYRRTFYLPAPDREFDIQFFPEGGRMLAVARQNVAFKVQGADGFSREISGFLLNGRGDTLASVQSVHNGMGVISMEPRVGESYQLVATTADGTTRRFRLPDTEPAGLNLAIGQRGNTLFYEIQKTGQTPFPDELYLLAHTRGQLAVCQRVGPGRTGGRLDGSQLHEGITHFLLVDGNGCPLSERLVFTYPKKGTSRWNIAPDRKRYAPRSRVRLAVEAHDAEGMPLQGSFSVSITDAGYVKPDSLAGHILSNLLLTSDLKGYIENPGYYFQRQDARTLRDMDLVMLTHGWRRHRLDSLTHPAIPAVRHKIERVQTIGGHIRGLFGGKVKKGPIYVLAPQQNILGVTETDKKGRFLLETSFPDSTSFLVQARTKNGFAGVSIHMDRPALPPASTRLPFRPDFRPAEDYLLAARNQYYTEGGMRVLNLKEVVVTGREQTRPSSMYVGINDRSYTGEQLGEYGALTALEALAWMPDVEVNGNEVTIRRQHGKPLVVVNDIVYEDDPFILSEIPTENIRSLTIVKDQGTILFGFRGSGGAIVIDLKKPTEMPAKPTPGILTYTPLGYSKDVEFYHPTYATPQQRASQKPDLRTTIYWNPALVLDAQGRATLEYYTPDSGHPACITIEGVDRKGNVHRHTRLLGK